MNATHNPKNKPGGYFNVPLPTKPYDEYYLFTIYVFGFISRNILRNLYYLYYTHFKIRVSDMSYNETIDAWLVNYPEF